MSFKLSGVESDFPSHIKQHGINGLNQTLGVPGGGIEGTDPGDFLNGINPAGPGQAFTDHSSILLNGAEYQDHLLAKLEHLLLLLARLSCWSACKAKVWSLLPFRRRAGGCGLRMLGHWARIVRCLGNPGKSVNFFAEIRNRDR